MNSPGSFVVIEFRAQDAEFTTNGDTHEVRGPTQWEKMEISWDFPWDLVDFHSFFCWDFMLIERDFPWDFSWGFPWELDVF